MSSRLSVLLFHRVLPVRDALFPEEMHAARFERLMRFLKRYWNVLPLSQAWLKLAAGCLPTRSLAITFDDGYADNKAIALPILRKHGIPATFFIATGFLDGGRMWNDSIIEAVRRTRRSRLLLRDLGMEDIVLEEHSSRRRAIDRLLAGLKYLPLSARSDAVEKIVEQLEVSLPRDLMMTSQDVRTLRDAGMEIGAHTVNHPILARLDTADAFAEISASKARLEEILGEPIRSFAYPNGKPQQDYLAEHVELVRHAGFELAVSTASGACDRGTDPFQLPRFTPWHEGHLAFSLALVRNALRDARGLPLA